MKFWDKLSFKNKRELTGLIFVSPFIIGFLLFFLYPFIQSIIFSVSKLKIIPKGFELEYVKLANYKEALFVNPEFVRTLIRTIGDILADVPLIIFFSLFAAILLNQKFKGRLIVRTIFFLPVIMGAGIISSLEQGDFVTQMLQGGQEAQNSFLSQGAINALLVQLKLPSGSVKYLLGIIDRVPEIIRASGVQILIFLAGLQSVPRSLYEASKVEGATAWENFWFITLPLMTPLILTNVVYTVIDSFTAGSNELVTLISDTAFGGGGYGVSTAMANMYFFAIAIILVITVLILSRWVFYNE